MGHSYLEYKEKNLHVHDSVLLVTFFWIMDHAKKKPDLFPPDQFPYFSEWQETLEPYIGGCVNFDIEQQLKTDESLQNFLKLAESARQALLQQPETMKGETLNDLFPTTDYFEYHDRPRAKTLQDFDRVLEFIKQASQNAP